MIHIYMTQRASMFVSRTKPFLRIHYVSAEWAENFSDNGDCTSDRQARNTSVRDNRRASGRVRIARYAQSV
jgi:hypothetical protein